jgi:ATP-binding cassette subfamily B protein
MTWAYKTQVIFVLFCVLFYSVIGRAIPYLFSLIVDNGMLKKDMPLVLKLLAVYVALETCRWTLNFLLSYRMEILGNRVLFDLRHKLIDHTQKLPLSYFDRTPVGRLVTRLTNDVLSIGDLYSQGFTAVFLSLIEIITISVAMVLLAPALGLTTLILAPIAIFITSKISFKLRHHFGESKKKMAELNAFTAESLGGMKVLKLFQQTEARESAFKKLAHEYLSIQLSTVKYFAYLWPTLSFFNIGTVTVTLLLGAWLHKNYGLTIGQLSAFILYVQGFYAPVRVILEQNNQFQNSLASADRIFNLLGEAEEPRDGLRFSSERLNGQIEIKNLTFTYKEGLPPALNNINMSIPAGYSIALVGRTGSGKTTLISLLQRLYELKTGDVLIDGKSIKDLSLTELRSRIGIIQQENFIFRGTLYENISLGSPNISREIAMYALKKARCLRLLERAKYDLDFKLEERGQNLSLGERQLIAFARIIAFNPDIIILDEATANIDSESERDLQLATEEVTLNRTCIIIAHRLSTILHCDHIYALKDGQILEHGTHEELMSQKGYYFDLYTKQLQTDSTYTSHT